MAIFHFSAQLIKRSAGRSATAAAAYRAGEQIHDQRTGLTFDYTKKAVEHREIHAPEDAPEWVYDRSELWNRAELAEKRKDAQPAREVEVSLPRELSREDQLVLVREFVRENFTSVGMVADVCVHAPLASDGKEQPHAHIMLTMRQLDGQAFAAKKDRSWNDKANIETWRESWANHMNAALERHQVKERVDHRSYERRGRDRAPGVHLGQAAHRMERRGIRTRRGNQWRAHSLLNQAIETALAYMETPDALAVAIKMAQKRLIEGMVGGSSTALGKAAATLARSEAPALSARSRLGKAAATLNRTEEPGEKPKDKALKPKDPKEEHVVAPKPRGPSLPGM